MVKFVTEENLGDNFLRDTVNKKIKVKIDNDLIVSRSDGTLTIDTTSSSFGLGVKSGETDTVLRSYTDPDTNARMLEYINETGVPTLINLSDLVVDIHIENAELEGEVLVLTSSTGQEIRVDLGKFVTTDELTTTLNSYMDITVTDAFDVPQGKMRSI